MTVKHQVALLGCMCVAASAPTALRAQGIGFIPAAAACGLKASSRVNSGMESLRTGTNTKFADQRTKAFKEAERDLTQAVGADDHGKSSGAWYYLARYYQAVNDLAGADSAFTKALALAPGCKDDIAFHRREAWVPVFNAATAAWQAGNTDSAIAAFRRANEIYQAEPLGFIYLANLFIARDEPDSALKQANAAKYHMDSLVYATRMDSAAKYFRLAVPAASDPKYANDRREAWLNVARVYHSEKRYDEAAAAYREFLGAYPNDVQARASLAELYLRANQRDSAMALYAAIPAHADSASADDLFGAAGAVLSAIPQLPDTSELDAACAKGPEAEDSHAYGASARGAVSARGGRHDAEVPCVGGPAVPPWRADVPSGFGEEPVPSRRALQPHRHLVRAQRHRQSAAARPATVRGRSDEPPVAHQAGGRLAARGEEGLRVVLPHVGGLAPD